MQQTVMVSASQLDNIQLCPRLHYFKNILYIEPAEGKDNRLERGEFFHYMLELHYKSLIDSDNKELIDIDTLREMAFNKATNYSLLADEVSGMIGLYREYRNFYPHEGSSWIPKEVEIPFAKIVYEDDDLRIILQGKIDLIAYNDKTKSMVVVDHKYSSRNYPVSERETQNLAYCLATGVDDFYINQAGDQKTLDIEKRMVRRYFNYSKHQIEEFQNDIIYWTLEILKNHVRVDNKDYIPANRKSCTKFGKRCTFFDLCQTTPDNVENKIKTEFIVNERKNLFKQEEEQ